MWLDGSQKWLSRLSTVALSAILLLSLSKPTFAENGIGPDTSYALSKEIASLLTFGNETTKVTISQCTLQIQTRVRTTCSYPTEPNWKQTTIEFNEVKDLDIQPFRDSFALRFELDVPSPSSLKTFFNRKIKGEDVAFEEFMEARKKLLEGSDIISNELITSCTGEEFLERKRSITLFLNAKPSLWNSLTSSISDCR